MLTRGRLKFSSDPGCSSQLACDEEIGTMNEMKEEDISHLVFSRGQQENCLTQNFCFGMLET